MNDPGPKNPPDRPHQAGVDRFQAMTAQERYGAMALPHGHADHVADEVIVTAARRAYREIWPDERKYSQQLLHRVYLHVRGHVGKNLAWSRRGGGFGPTADDCAQFVLVRLAADTSPICHAENAFGDYVYKRCLDFADTLFAKKNAATESLDDGVSESKVDDASSAAHASVLDELIAAEDNRDEQELLDRIRNLVQDEDLLTDEERMAFTFRWFGGIQNDSKDRDELTIRKLMRCSPRSVRNYQASALKKIKERL